MKRLAKVWPLIALAAIGCGAEVPRRDCMALLWPPPSEASQLSAPECDRPSLSIGAIEREGDGARIEARFVAAGTSGAPLDESSIRGARLLAMDAASGHMWLTAEGLGDARARLAIEVRDEEGVTAEASVVSWAEPRDARDAIVYQVMIDRFRGDGGAALDAPSDAGARAGGTLSGVMSALDELADAGVDTLWLSPVYQGPSPALLGKDGRLYQGYHGYWPIDARAVEPRIGGEAALEALVGEAHARDMALLLDLVPNHVHEDHPRYAAHREWFGQPGCVCGTPSCPWAGNIETCWFAPYLPDVDWDAGGAMQAASDDARFWLERFDVDGVRIDAVPMMPRSATRRIAADLRALRGGDAPLLLGEVFTGPGQSQVDELGRHLGSEGLDAVFDFPLMWALHEVIARGRGSFASVEALLQYQEETLDGALLGRMLDNHDTPRFVSVANGDAHGDPWLAPADAPSEEAYRRLALGLATIFTLPGMVVLYQGDEIGLPGAGDPDNRRVMPADHALSDTQRELRALTSRLGALRRCSPALRRGARIPLLAGSDRYAYLRDGDHPAIVVISTATEPVSLTLPEEAGSGTWRDALSGDTVSRAIDMAPLSARVLLRPDDPCAP